MKDQQGLRASTGIEYLLYNPHRPLKPHRHMSTREWGPGYPQTCPNSATALKPNSEHLARLTKDYQKGLWGSQSIARESPRNAKKNILQMSSWFSIPQEREINLFLFYLKFPALILRATFFSVPLPCSSFWLPVLCCSFQF